MIDTHCHLTSRVLADDVEGIVRRAREAGVSQMITVATTSADAEHALALAHGHSGVFCTAGVHPLYAEEPVDWPVLRAIIQDERCVAWGELGLDNYYREPARSLQDEMLARQLDLIAEVDREGPVRPVIVHSREAQTDLLPVLEASGIDPARFVFHCFTGTPEEADRLIAFGSMISFTGAVTYRSGAAPAEAARRIPLDRIMVETDAPYMTPEPNRKIRPNVPAFVGLVAQSIAHNRGMHPTEFEAITDANARRFFGLPGPGAAEEN